MDYGFIGFLSCALSNFIQPVQLEETLSIHDATVIGTSALPTDTAGNMIGLCCEPFITRATNLSSLHVRLLAINHSLTFAERLSILSFVVEGQV